MEWKDVSVAVPSQKSWHTASSRNPCKTSTEQLVQGSKSVRNRPSAQNLRSWSTDKFQRQELQVAEAFCSLCDPSRSTTTSVPQPCFRVQTPQVAVMKPWEQLSPRSHRIASWQQILPRLLQKLLIECFRVRKMICGCKDWKLCKTSAFRLSDKYCLNGLWLVYAYAHSTGSNGRCQQIMKPSSHPGSGREVSHVVT